MQRAQSGPIFYYYDVRWLNTFFSCPPQDKDKVSLNKTPKLDRSDGGKEVKEKTTKRKLPFSVGTNGDQKDSDTGKNRSGVPPSPTLPALLWYDWRFFSCTRAVCIVNKGLSIVGGEQPLGSFSIGVWSGKGWWSKSEFPVFTKLNRCWKMFLYGWPYIIQFFCHT